MHKGVCQNPDEKMGIRLKQNKKATESISKHEKEWSGTEGKGKERKGKGDSNLFFQTSL